MFIVLDLETTGLSAKDDSIIELAMVKIDRETFKEVDRISTFVNPGIEIPAIISQITNIFDHDVEGAPKFSEVENSVQEFIEGLPIIGHNIAFDIRFLESHGIDVGTNPSIDTFFLANFLCHDLKSLNLGFLCDHFGIELENAHRAIDDTLATVKLFQKLVEKLSELPEEEKLLVGYYLNRCNSVGLRILQDQYLSFGLKDFSDFHPEKIYLQNIKKQKVDIADISRSEEIKNIHEFLNEIPDFELRENQKRMLDKVDNTLTKGGNTLIEAPTGIGKTYAYLLPAIKHSLSFGEAVHISTSTKALQDQIYYKDLTFLSKNFPESFSFTKLKGKRNYLGISAFLEFLDDPSRVTPHEISFILKILFWSSYSEFGELDEVDFYGEEYSFLSEIHAGNAFTFDDSNPYKDIEFAFRARKRAKSANIIITNNHILFQDMVSEGALLGGVKNLILDEAHSLEDIVTQSLRQSTSFTQMKNLFDRIEKKLQKLQVSKLDIATLKQTILFDIGEVFSILESKLFEKFSFDTKYKNLLLRDDFFSDSEHIETLIKKITADLRALRTQLNNQGEQVKLKISQEVLEITSVVSHFEKVFIGKDIQENIFFISHDENRGTQLYSTVLHPGKFLEENLWNTLDSAVLTSATLQMQDDFYYVKNVLNLEGFDTMQLESDFDYEKQALLFVPDNLGNVKNNLPEIVKFLEIFFSLVKGRTLVLFTAFAAIREVYSTLKIKLEQKEIYLLAQSISGSKHKQIDFFKKNSKNSILLGTDTFWEGIDIPGDALQYLLIHKIPFSVPSDPIFQARSKLFSDSFSEYAIPKAILKLKQGFGRLIRTKNDSGIVIFLDDRIRTTRWGEKFLAAFPNDIKIRYGGSNKLIEILSRNQ